MQTLWLRFAEDSSLPSTMDAEARARFDSIFSAASPDSAWNMALQTLGLPASTSEEALVTWHHDTPYINWSQVVQLISSGLVSVAADTQGGFHYKVGYRLSRLLSLIRSQWAISRYILRCMEEGYTPPAQNSARINESIAHGLAALALTMRLPAHTEQQLADWLANPAALPSSLRRTVTQMQRIQQLRTTLSPAWSALFPGTHAEEARDSCPDYFWDTPPAEAAMPSTPIDNSTTWKGMGVAGGSVTGRAVLVTRQTDINALKAGSDKPVLIFPLARPESVELFEYASAVLFGEGGVMSHACTIAREQNLPCITALGKNFISRIKAEMESGKNIWLSVDPQQGTVALTA